MKRLLGFLGRGFLLWLEETGRLWGLLRSSLYWIFIAPLKGKGVKRHYVTSQMVEIGVNSIGIVFLMSLFMGMVLALQTAYQLKKFGALVYVASLLAIAFVREIGPLLTAIVVAGRSGSAMAAELGTMKVSEEIQALETMGVNPVRFLVIPRLVAIMVMLPCVTVLADVVGMFGGGIVGTAFLGIPGSLYFQKSVDFLVMKDVVTGLLKSGVFAALIALIGCYQGLRVEGGAEGVGRATTKAVVTAIISIIVADCFFTGLFYFIWG